MKAKHKCSVLLYIRQCGAKALITVHPFLKDEQGDGEISNAFNVHISKEIKLMILVYSIPGNGLYRM